MKDYIKPYISIECTTFDVIVMSEPSGEDPWGEDIWG